MRKSSVILFCILSFMVGFFTRCSNFIPLGNSCTLPKEEKIFSPSKTAYVVMRSSLCGLLQNRYITIGVYYDHSYMSIDVNENTFSSMDVQQIDINWSDKSLSTRSHPLPKIIWKDNYQVDIYVQTRVRFGTEIISRNIDIIDEHTNKVVETKPFSVVVHYERQD